MSALDLSMTPERRESKTRADLMLIFHESGVEPPEMTVVALAATMRRIGFAIVTVPPDPKT